MKILFMGDSITDAGKSFGKGSQLPLGQGYALMTAGRLGVKYPGRFTFINNGNSGDRIVDLYARIKIDVWNHAPDVLSILVGINDVWHEILNGNGVDAERFGTVYRMYITDTLRRFPGMKIILMEPFVGNCSLVAENREYFRDNVRERAVITERLAAETGVFFLPLQKMFDNACRTVGAEYWFDDGVHPFPAGHQLISDAWIGLFEKEIL